MAGKTTSNALLAARYANALYDLAIEQGKQDKIAQDMTSLAAILDSHAELAAYFQKPNVVKSEVSATIEAVSKLHKLDTLTFQFLGVLTENRRLSMLAECALAFAQRHALEKGEKTANVVSAAPLNHAQHQKLSDSLAAHLGGKVSIHSSVDESLIGGLVIQIGSQLIDSSVKTRLDKLEQAMKGAA